MTYLLQENDLNQIAIDLKSVMADLNNSRILISGCTGFIGKNLLETILWTSKIYNLNIDVLGISRNPKLFYQNYPHFKNFSKLKILSLDIKDVNALDVGHIDYVIHGATDVSQVAFPIQLFEDAYWGTKHILDFSERANVKSFLLLSSGAVYGNSAHADGFLEEQVSTVNLQASSSYALAKQTSEWLCSAYENKFEIKIARCFAFVGPYLPLDKHFAIGNFINSAIKNLDIEIQGNGKPTRSYLYTSDMTTILLKLCFSEGIRGRWNIGGEYEISMHDLAMQVNSVLGSSGQVIVHGKRAAPTDRYFPNIDKIKKQFLWQPKVSLDEAIKKTANWNFVKS